MHSAIITSELNSTEVANICSQYNWKQYYYFFHGWAALDWYRGYDRTFLMPTPAERKISKTFIAPNRIVAGKRNHRLAMLYYIFKKDMLNNWISCPDVCPAENTSIIDCVSQLQSQYPDIVDVFQKQTLPLCFPGETDHPMHSCWLSLFDQSAESLLYLVTETVATHQRLHLTEKTFKPICLKMPFVIVGTQGSLAYLRSYGFKTFGDIWDESYDNEPNDSLRIEKVANLLEKLNQLTPSQKQDLFDSTRSILEHNYNHFYQGAFESILWQELLSMLNNLKSDFSL